MYMIGRGCVCMGVGVGMGMGMNADAVWVCDEDEDDEGECGCGCGCVRGSRGRTASIRLAAELPLDASCFMAASYNTRT